MALGTFVDVAVEDIVVSVALVVDVAVGVMDD